MRGSLADSTKGNAQPGIIPAGAGLTALAETMSFVFRDHPRGCGAHTRTSARHSTQWGSSPRVRGSRSSPASCALTLGIIPAGAGLTRRGEPCCGSLWDHPRGCGAHERTVIRNQVEEGSSPRVRGSLQRGSESSAVRGIIPAGAGLTTLPETPAGASRDHPRGCGAHPEGYYFQWIITGSSPRVRGSHLEVTVNQRFLGIIPAGAGLTQNRCTCIGCPWDHPRGCGAHWSNPNDIVLDPGSSPRVRGSPSQRL